MKTILIDDLFGGTLPPEPKLDFIFNADTLTLWVILIRSSIRPQIGLIISIMVFLLAQDLRKSVYQLLHPILESSGQLILILSFLIE